MRIAMTMKQRTDRHGQVCDVLEQEYVRYFKSLLPGARCIPIPNIMDVATALFNDLSPSLLVLSGGNGLDGSVPDRDQVERELAKLASESAIPMVGICRGMQHLNVLLGGNIEYSLSGHSPGQDHDAVGEDGIVKVNSHHDHGIFFEGLAEGVTPLLMAGKVVEAFAGRMGNSRILGVQWHPERSAVGRQWFEESFFNRIGPSLPDPMV